MLLSMLFVYGVQYYMDADTYSLVCVCSGFVVGVFVLGLELFSSPFNIMIRSSHAHLRKKSCAQ